MRLLFIRHGIAEERTEFSGDDLLRPLTAAGRRKAQAAFAGLAAYYHGKKAPELVVHSAAVRARQTAKLLAKAVGCELREDPGLNPGAGLESLLRLLAQSEMQVGSLALVGHEPDFSEMISGLIQNRPEDGRAAPFLHIDVKKAGCVEVNVYAPGQGELKAVLPPRLLRALRQ